MKKPSKLWIVLMLAAIVGLQKFGILPSGNNSNSSGNSEQVYTDNSNNTPGSDKEILKALQSNKLIYTKHAKCRMECRFIDKEEVRGILKDGRINYKKSKPKDQPCPSYAIEGFTKDKQEVRIVFALCSNVSKVITTIDLGNKYNCHCD